MRVKIDLLELVQCIAALACERHGDAFNPRLQNHTGHIQVGYTGNVTSLRRKIDGAIDKHVELASGYVLIELESHNSEAAIIISGGDGRRNKIRLDLPGKISLIEPISVPDRVALTVLVESTDAVLLSGIEALQTKLNIRCYRACEPDNGVLDKGGPDLEIIDCRVSGSEKQTRVAARSQSLAKSTVYLHSIGRLDFGEKFCDEDLIWPYFDTDLLLLLNGIEKNERLSVLVADDSAPSRMATRVMLELLGCDVVCASDGNEALQMAMAQKFDLVFLDERMPGLNGSEVAKHLLQDASRNIATPKVSLTGITDPSEMALLYEKGITHHLTKPVTKLVLENFLVDWRAGLPTG